MRRIFPGSRKPMHYIISIFVTHHYEVWRSCWADMRKVLDGEWGELQWFIHLRNEKKKTNWKERDCTPSGSGIIKLLGYCENRICEQVSMIGFEDTERKTSTLVEECILNCSTEDISCIKKIKWSQHVLITDLMTSENYYTSWHVFE